MIPLQCYGKNVQISITIYCKKLYKIMLKFKIQQKL